jgi:predicted Zn finger-like uncharacterized protein
VIIRCERCSTMYELDESLLARDGSQVQCTKCQHVFTAFPPGSGVRAAAEAPPAPPPAPPPAAPPQASETSGVVRGPYVAGAPAPARTATSAAPASPPAASRNGGRPLARSSSPPVYRPPTSAPAVGRAPVLRKNTVGSFEARLRWTARWRWLAPAVALALVAAIAAGVLLLRRDGDRTSDRTRPPPASASS